MYNAFFKLKPSPFNVTSNPDFFFESHSHKEAITVLLYGIQQRKGIIVITGEVGTGKTTLCKVLLKKLPSSIKTALILNPYFSEVQLLQAVVEDFGIAIKKRSKLDIVNHLNKFLLEINASNSTAVLIIDEAQNLTNRQLEHIRLLSNLEAAYYKLLQIVLVGQPELENKLSQDSLRQIRQRVFVKYRLKPLKEEEIPEYINFRLNRIDDSKIRFVPDVYKRIYEFSEGIPRLINMVCDRAILCSFVRNIRTIDMEIIEESIKELV